MPLRYKARLLKHLAHDAYVPSAIEQLAADLRVPPGELEDFRTAVLDLAKAGQLVHDKNIVSLPPIGKFFTGTFRKHPKGFGFIVPRDPTAHGDLFVPAGRSGDAQSGDIVKARVRFSDRPQAQGKSPYVGEIEEVLERKKSNYTGELRKRGGQWLVYPDGKAFPDPIVVRDAESKNAREGDKVVIEILNYPEGNTLGEGVIVKVLGDAGKPNVETQAIIEAFNLPGEFPEECVEQAREATRRYDEEMARIEQEGLDPNVREDLRNDYIITIDPPDAKDYDDAISVERLDKLPNSNQPGWKLGVHIADVSHFIPPGSPLDRESRERANSVYLPRLVIPMLPEILSNGICSLQEGVPRYCKTAWMLYDDEGRIRGTAFGATLIKSAKRLTYIEAQALIEGNVEKAKQHAKTEAKYTPELRDTVLKFDRLAKAIQQRRQKQGMIHLDLPEVELVYDAEGHVIDAVPEDDSFTHTLIEMFMVEANEAVARLFEDLRVPLLRRTHPEPVPGDTGNLQDFVRVAGFKIPKNPTREDLQGLLNATKGSPSAPAIHMAVLRTLSRAEYSPAIIGHFALASEAYAHFTSPIRRYADLTVHRALTEFLSLTRNGNDPPRDEREAKNLGRKLRESEMCPDEGELISVGSNCNFKEENATAAERELRQFLVLQLLTNHIGESFPAICTGVTPNGVFVRLDKFLAEGMCKVEDLPVVGKEGKPLTNVRPDWRIDPRSGALVERNSGRSYAIGHRFEVTIVEIDLARRQMDLVVTDSEARGKGKVQRLADKLKLGGGDFAGGLDFDERTGVDKRAARSKSRERNKQDFRQDRKDKGRR